MSGINQRVVGSSPTGGADRKVKGLYVDSMTFLLLVYFINFSFEMIYRPKLLPQRLTKGNILLILFTGTAT